MYPKELVKLLEKDGWVKISQSGSHLKMRKRKADGNHSYAQQGNSKRASSNHFKKDGAEIIPSPFL